LKKIKGVKRQGDLRRLFRPFLQKGYKHKNFFYFNGLDFFSPNSHHLL